jgi:hypothetical protein
MWRTAGHGRRQSQARESPEGTGPQRRRARACCYGPARRPDLSVPAYRRRHLVRRREPTRSAEEDVRAATDRDGDPLALARGLRRSSRRRSSNPPTWRDDRAPNGAAAMPDEELHHFRRLTRRRGLKNNGSARRPDALVGLGTKVTVGFGRLSANLSARHRSTEVRTPWRVSPVAGELLAQLCI